MAGKAGAIRAGRAFVELFTESSAFVRGLNSAKAQLQAFSKFATRFGTKLLGLAGTMASPFIVAVKAASDFQETLNKFGQSFGDQTAAAEEFANTLAQTVGRSRNEIMKGMAAFQAMFTGLGFDGEEARLMSQQLQALSIDFASFHNIADDESLQRFIAALSGSPAVMDQFGVNIREAEINNELLNMGLRATSQTATEQQKTLARLAIIMRAMGNQGATGDAIRTAGSFANQMKRLKAEFIDAAVAVGGAILPALAELAGKVSGFVKQFAGWASQNREVIVTFGKVVLAVGAVGAALVALGTVASATGAVVGLLATAVGLLLTPMGLAVGTAIGLFAAFGDVEGAMKSLGNTATEFGNVFSQAWTGIKDAMAAGDLKLAAEIAFAAIDVAWNRLLDKMRNAWEKFTQLKLPKIALQWNGETFAEFGGGENTTPVETVSQESQAAQDRLDELNRQAAVKAMSARHAERAAALVDQALGDQAGGAAPGQMYDSTGRPVDNRNLIQGSSIPAREEIEEMRQPLRKTSSEGTFSAYQAAAFGVGTSTAEERTARATEQTALHTREMDRQLRNNRGIVS